MNRFILANCNVFDGCSFIGDRDILIDDGKIIDIDERISHDYCNRIDMQHAYASPGFIDIHMHGACGWDFTNASEDGLRKICRYLAGHGVTSVVATALTAKNEKIRCFLQQIKVFNKRDHTGANILGAHLEGPFVNPKRKGGLNEQYIQKPTVENFENIVSGYEDIVRTVTLAPEVQGVKELIRYLLKKEVYVSIGHSEATYDEVVNAVNDGASRATHIFNGMAAFNHREPGTAGGLLDCKNVFVEMIVDLIHLHPAVVRLILRAAGLDRCICISDAIEATGLEDGEYDIGGKTVVVRDGVSRLKDTLSLSGSTTILDQSVKNLTAIGISLEDALKTVTSNPAKAIGINGKKGWIKTGFDADITVLDENLDVNLTLINGEIFEK